MRVHLKTTLFANVLLILVPVCLWLQAASDLSYYSRQSSPPGQFYYVLSKLFGLQAMLFLWYQVCYGLIGFHVGKKNLTHFGHKKLGITVAIFMLLHFALFFVAVWMRKEEFPKGLLIPEFTDYYQVGLAYGQIAFAFLLLTLYSGRRRASDGARVWRWLHRLALLVFVLALIHSYMIGSETRWFFLPWVYLGMLVSVLVLLVIRKHKFLQ